MTLELPILISILVTHYLTLREYYISNIDLKEYLFKYEDYKPLRET